MIAKANDGGAVELDPNQATLDKLARDYAAKRVVREQLDAATKEARKVEEEAEHVLFQAMQAQGASSFRHPELGLFRLDDKAWAKVLDRGALVQWCEDHMPDILAPNSTRLSGYIRNLLRGEETIESGKPSEYGVDLPPGVGVTFAEGISWTRR